jgi:hypothetical protein
MVRKGRDLEILVANLEKHLSHTEIHVTSPDYILGRRSGSRREVDVALRAKIGSSNVLVIVECRDRAATEDVTWVEQLANKREDVGADKAVAVSATGFTEGAKNAAAAFGIPLRTLEQVDLSEALLWFPFSEIALDKLCWELHHIDVAVDKDVLASLQSLLGSLQNVAAPLVNEIPFRAKHNGSVALIWQHLWNDLPGPRIYAEVRQTVLEYDVLYRFSSQTSSGDTRSRPQLVMSTLWKLLSSRNSGLKAGPRRSRDSSRLSSRHT